MSGESHGCGWGSPVRAILYAFFANFGIALIKTGAWIYTGSSSMLAEAIHSYADTDNQVLLLIGLKRSERPPDAEHPLGYGKVSYFWGFVVAVLLYSVGSLFSLYEGWHKLHATEPVRNVWVALVVLGVSIVLEAFSMWGCMREINKMRGDRPLWHWLHESRNAALAVVCGEDLAALLGLLLAFGFLTMASLTGDPVYDAIGSMCIGLLLLISVFVAIRVQKLLIGRSADSDIEAAIAESIRDDADTLEVFNVITLQMGANIMVAAKIRLAPELPVATACERINELEVELKQRVPGIGWCFIEPDITD